MNGVSLLLFRMSLFIEDGEWIEHRGYTITYLNKNYANSNYQIIDRESKSEEVLITNYHHEIQQGVLFE